MIEDVRTSNYTDCDVLCAALKYRVVLLHLSDDNSNIVGFPSGPYTALSGNLIYVRVTETEILLSHTGYNTQMGWHTLTDRVVLL